MVHKRTNSNGEINEFFRIKKSNKNLS